MCLVPLDSSILHGPYLQLISLGIRKYKPCATLYNIRSYHSTIVTRFLASFTNLESYYSGIMRRDKSMPSLFSINVHTERLASNIYVVNC